MSGDTGAPRRRYTSPVRTARARQTRARIVAAAAALFAERGYLGTTIDAVAQAAGVGRKTVFDSVGGKVSLLKEAYDVAIVGDDEPVPLAERPVIAALAAEPDPRTMLAGYAALVCQVNARIVDIYRALETGAETDPEARELYERLLAQRRQAMVAPAAKLAAAGALRAGLTGAECADLLWLHNDPSMYDKLVRRMGWSPERFQMWLAQTYQEQLLAHR